MKPEYFAVIGAVVSMLGTGLVALPEKPTLKRRVLSFVLGLLGVLIASIAGIYISNETTDLLTGGDDFCYLVTEGTPSPPFPTVAVHDGKNPLYRVEMRVVDLSEYKLLPDHTFAGETKLTLGDFPAGPAVKGPLPLALSTKGDQASFNIFFDARNGFWIENLRLRLVNHQWKKALRVFRTENEIIFEIHDKGFPTTNGHPDWQE